MKVTILATGFSRVENQPIDRIPEQEKQKVPIEVSPKQYDNFEDPPYLRKKKPQVEEKKEPVKATQKSSSYNDEREPVPFKNADNEDFLPKIFGSLD